ncbi:MAG: GGDEF domain-containing protein [Acidobacteriota bacterium]
MISLKKYLDGEAPQAEGRESAAPEDILAAALAAYGSALAAAGNYSLDACPGLGDGLKRQLWELRAGLSPAMSRETVGSTDQAVQEQLRDWGQRTARHYRDRAAEVKELLLTMARTGESVSARDQRCSGRMSEVTARLQQIATLDDLSAIRASIEKSAAELRLSIDRMTAEGKAAVEELKKQVSTYHAKLEAAEELASRDVLTGARNRMCIESMMESRAAEEAVFCVAMIDIDGFKKVNDTHGHLVGDELLKQFAVELRSACRSTDAIGRWGGDEFLILLDCRLPEATAQVERLRKWVCGDYTLATKAGPMKQGLNASIGLAERLPQESIQALLARADAAMYERKRVVSGSGARP